MTRYSLVLPPDFDDNVWEPKGFFSMATLVFADKKYRITFYEPVRLQQEVEDEFRRGSVFFEPNLVVVPAVTRPNMERAIEILVEGGLVDSLSSE